MFACTTRARVASGRRSFWPTAFPMTACAGPRSRAFQANYDVVMVDARGHGCSDAPQAGYGPDVMAEDLRGVITGLVGGRRSGAFKPDVAGSIERLDRGPSAAIA
jgi:pimeloyl-ACP methyl ester carboxylesterase